MSDDTDLLLSAAILVVWGLAEMALHPKRTARMLRGGDWWDETPHPGWRWSRRRA